MTGDTSCSLGPPVRSSQGPGLATGETGPETVQSGQQVGHPHQRKILLVLVQPAQTPDQVGLPAVGPAADWVTLIGRTLSRLSSDWLGS